MIKGIKKGLAVAAVLALTAGCFAGCGAKVNSEDVAAVVGEENVPMGVASVYARYNQAQMFAMYSQYMSSMGMPQIFDQALTEGSDETYGDQMKDELMDYIVNMYIVRSHADEYGVTLTEEEQAAIDEVAKNFVAANEASALKKIGTTEEHVKELMTLYTYSEKMYDVVVADVDTEVSDEEAQQSKLTYIKISLEGTETDEEGNTIALTEDEIAAKEDMAKGILTALLQSADPAAEDMSALAAEFEEGLTATPYTYDEEDSYLDSAVLDSVAGLSDGEVVENVVASTDGKALYVVRFDAELDREATDYQKENIVHQRQQDKYTEVLEGWKEAATYETTEAWDKFSINDSDIYTFKAATETAE